MSPETRAKISTAAKLRTPWIRTPEHRARQAAASTARPHVIAIFTRAGIEARRINWCPAMQSALLSQYVKGRSVEYIAEEIGVARSVVEAEMDRLNLPRGRWVTIIQRREAAAPHLDVPDLLRSA